MVYCFGTVCKLLLNLAAAVAEYLQEVMAPNAAGGLFDAARTSQMPQEPLLQPVSMITPALAATCT